MSDRNRSARLAAARSRVLGLRRHQPRYRLQQIQHIQVILQHDAVVHRAALVVSAIGEDLLVGFAQQDIEATLAPAVGLRTAEKHAAEKQRLAVLQQVIGEQVIFESPLEPGQLGGEAVQPGLRRIGQLRLPVHALIQFTTRRDTG